MPSHTHTYFFARLNLLGQWQNKQAFLFQALSANSREVDHKFKYGFFDATEIKSDSGPFAFGHLVKYKSVLEGETVDEKTHRLVEGGLPEGVVAKAEFFLHYHTAVTAYRPITSKLSGHQFRKMFARLIEAANQKFFINAELQSIDEDFEIYEAIRRFQIISGISFDLHPTNPSNRETYRNVDERLKRLNAQRLRQILTAAEGGLNQEVLKDDDALRGLIMAADGYGKGSIRGEIDGRSVVITTDDSPVRKEVVPSDNPDEVLYQLLPVFNQIWERMSK